MALERTSSARAEFLFTELYRDAEHVMGSYANLVILASVAPPTPRVVAASRDVAQRVAVDHPEGVGVFIVIDSRAGPPDEASRKALEQVYVELRKVVRAAVHVVEGEGFVAAAKRGALTLINLTVKPGFPTKVASTIDDGIAVMRRTLGPFWLKDVQPHLLSREMTQARASLSPPSRRKR
jgi:hypothetical protein